MDSSHVLLDIPVICKGNEYIRSSSEIFNTYAGEFALWSTWLLLACCYNHHNIPLSHLASALEIVYILLILVGCQ